MTVIKLTVVNDLICAFCYIGHYELNDALNRVAKMPDLDVQFEIEYRPFRLINTACICEKSKVDKKTFFLAKLGQEKLEAMGQTVKKWTDEKGIVIDFNGVISQTTRAHRLSRKAYHLGGQRYQLPLINGIFKAFCGESKDIGDVDVLADLAEQVGMMSKDEAIKFLESDELLDEVTEMAENARASGISGIPVTVIDGKWAVSGGQSSDVYFQIFKKLATCNGLHTKCPDTLSPPFSKVPMLPGQAIVA